MTSPPLHPQRCTLLRIVSPLGTISTGSNFISQKLQSQCHNTSQYKKSLPEGITAPLALQNPPTDAHVSPCRPAPPTPCHAGHAAVGQEAWVRGAYTFRAWTRHGAGGRFIHFLRRPGRQNLINLKISSSHSASAAWRQVVPPALVLDSHRSPSSPPA